MQAAFFLGLLQALSAHAAPAAAPLSTSIASTQTCITKIRPGPPASSLPTTTLTTAKTISSTQTVSGSASTSTLTVTPEVITSTEILTSTQVSLGSAATIYTTITAAGNGSETGACSSTVTVTADPTTTVYTGTYTPPAAKETAAVAQKAATFAVRKFAVNAVQHFYGQQQNMGPNRQPFEVDCVAQVTTYIVSTETLSVPAAVETITASGATVYVTSTQQLSVSATSEALTVTSTITDSPFVNSTGSVCTQTTGEAIATTTQHLKCAPTNLIGSMPSNSSAGIAQVQGGTNTTQGLTDGTDPSACCQVCVDTPNCAASEDDQGAGNCFLWYSSTCGLGFSYGDGGRGLAPGAGFLVQTGCGSIEEVIN